MGFMLTTEIDSENPVIHDLRLVNGQLRFLMPSIENQTEYSEIVAQRIKTRLLFERGEWYLDQRLGTPWKTRVTGKAGVSKGLDQVREMIYTVVAGTPGVQSVQTITLDLDRAARSLTISIKATGASSEPIDILGLSVPFVVSP